MILSSKSVYEFIPVFNGNQSLQGDDQVIVEIIRPKAEERSELYSMDIERDISSGEFSGQAPTKTSVTFKRRYNVSRILRKHIGKIRGLEDLRPDGTRVPIKDGSSLAESTMYGVGSLIDELCAEVIGDILSTDEKKIFKEPLK